MRPIDADAILCDGFNEWLACVLCGQATKEHPSCDGACDMQARLYADRAADALISWLADVPTIDAEPVRHGRWVPRNSMIKEPFGKNYDCSVCGCNNIQYKYCPKCGAKMDEVNECG